MTSSIDSTGTTGGRKLGGFFHGTLIEIGSIWAWEPRLPHARCLVEVTDYKVNSDGEVWIETDGSLWNEAPRFIEACVLVCAPLGNPREI